MSKQTQTINVTQTPEAVYAALKAAVEKLRYRIAAADDDAYTLSMTTGVSAFSWGENIEASVAADENGGSVVTLSSAPKLKTNVVDMGRAKRELKAIADALLAELNGTGAQPVQAAAKPAEATSVADELRKLAVLRDEGVLTEEEFTAAKKKLLGI